ncbi:S8 family serine peptidase [Sporosarcina luteola]|uniref:S8 family peptidase n=1 Tax=Sporosarcina luteola TaxID=582850 RepID=UPI00203B4702|nr:S8 family serine peptidase [Sporosarcina luteola]MCM3745594.1 S8 family serine peptidase [Sporosarcina luteola]
MKELYNKGKSQKIIATALTLGFAMNMLVPFASAEELIDTEKEYVVVYKNNSGKDAVIRGSKKVKTQFKSINAVAVKASPNAMKALEKNPNIASVEENIKFSLVNNKNAVQVLNKVEAKSTGTTIPAEESQWDIQAMKVSNAWNEGLTGKGVKVAVVDSGVANHPDLLIKGGVSTVDYTTSFNDDNGHGTHVAGSIGAKRDGRGLVGVAPDADLYAVKVMDQDGSGYLIDILEGLDWSIVNKMDVVNMSLGTSADSKAFHDMVAKAQINGIVLIAANGNDGVGTPVNFPAKYNEVIAVSAVDQSLQIGSFSSTGVETEFSSPGVAIVSTYLNGSYARLDGTSMASPHVAGFVALLKQKNPTMTNAQLRAELQKYATDLGDAGRDSLFGYGFLTYESVKAPTVPPAPVVDTTAPAVVNNVKLTATTYTSASFSWTNPTDADFAKTNIYLNGRLLGSVDKGTQAVNVTGLTRNTSYTVMFKTVDITGNESAGVSLKFTTKR